MNTKQPISAIQTMEMAEQKWRELSPRIGQTIFQSCAAIQRDGAALADRLRRLVMRGKAGPDGILVYSERQQWLANFVRAAEPTRQQRVAAARDRQDAAEKEKARLKTREAEITDRQSRIATEQAQRGDDAADRYAAAVAEGDEAAAAAAEAEVSKIEAEREAHDAAARADAPVVRAVLGRLAQCEIELAGARTEMVEAVVAVEDAAIECAQFEWNAAAARLVVAATNCKLDHESRGRPWHLDDKLTVPLFKRGGDCPGAHVDARGVPVFLGRSFHEISQAAGVVEPADLLFAELRDFMKHLDDLERSARADEERERGKSSPRMHSEQHPLSIEHEVAAHVARLSVSNKSSQAEPVREA